MKRIASVLDVADAQMYELADVGELSDSTMIAMASNVQRSLWRCLVADRSSARVFGFFFTMLAENPTQEHRSMALEVWEEAKGYDFEWHQMDADDALLKLDLMRKKTDEYGDMVWFYGPEGDDSP